MNVVAQIKPATNPSISIAGRQIGSHMLPYIVAEISGNHGGDIGKARALIRAARDAGANAVKLQTYTPDELTSWAQPDLWELYEKAQTPWGWHQELFDHAYKLGITIFSSAFSVRGVKFLENLGVPAIKIASMEAYNEELVRAANETGLPVIISLGMCDGGLPSYWCGPNKIWLHCVAQYPSRIEDANLRVISRLGAGNSPVGLSDHTPGYETAIAATALGAVMIEKHIKLDDDCIDAAYSLVPENFAAMCDAVRAVWHGMGDGVIRPTCEPRKR